MVVAAGLLATVAVLAALARDRPWDVVATWHWSAVPGTLVILAAAPCFAYGWTSARTTGGTQLTDDTLGLDHWPVQAALSEAGVARGILAAREDVARFSATANEW
jgi:hypothetical protein